MKRLIYLLMVLLALGIMACSKADTKQEVITFASAIAAIERDSETWAKDFQVFLTYSPGMTLSARQAKYNELLQRLNTLKQRALDVQRPSIPEARSVHDKYVQTWSKLTEMFAVLPGGDVVRVQSLYDESILLNKQFYEQMDDLLRKYGLTRPDVGLPK